MAGLDTGTQPVVTPLDAALVKAVGDFCRRPVAACLLRSFPPSGYPPL